MVTKYQNKVKKARLSSESARLKVKLRNALKKEKIAEKRKKAVGIKLARQMKKDGYDDSDIVQATGYHI